MPHLCSLPAAWSIGPAFVLGQRALYNLWQVLIGLDHKRSKNAQIPWNWDSLFVLWNLDWLPLKIRRFLSLGRNLKIPYGQHAFLVFSLAHMQPCTWVKEPCGTQSVISYPVECAACTFSKTGVAWWLEEGQPNPAEIPTQRCNGTYLKVNPIEQSLYNLCVKTVSFRCLW